MDAFVTVRYKVSNICSPDDVDETYTFQKLVKDIIDSEGIHGIADDAGEVIQVEEVK